jgi:acyl carrier protein
MSERQPVSEDALCRWMIEAIARLIHVEPSSLGPASAFEDLGLTSLAAVRLAAEISDAFGIEVDALVTWDYATIGEVAQAICRDHDGQPSPDRQ